MCENSYLLLCAIYCELHFIFIIAVCQTIFKFTSVYSSLLMSVCNIKAFDIAILIICNKYIFV